MRRTPTLTGEQRKELEAIIRASGNGAAEVRRAQAVLLVNDGAETTVIPTLTGYSRQHAFALRRAYLQEGRDALRDKRRGNPRALLTKRQRTEVVDILHTKQPSDFRYARDQWTTTILGDLIERRYGVRYRSKTSERLLFREARITYHKPGRVYHRRDEDEVHASAVATWLTKDRRVEILSFPRYAPEENPQEHVWKAGRSQVTTASSRTSMWRPMTSCGI